MLACVVLFALTAALGAAEPSFTMTEWGGPAQVCYDTGFVRNLQRASDGAVSLFGMELIENDAPGAGQSEKGVWNDTIWGAHRARKVIHLADPRAHRAYVVVFTNNGHHTKEASYPLRFEVNGRLGEITKNNSEVYRWAEFPADALKPGDNIIELYCPEAATEQEGWNLYLARADEFIQGGGDPRDVGKTSFKSRDGGETWQESPFGPDGATRAEYVVRLSLDRYLPEGILETPVLDLWTDGADQNLITPLRNVEEVTIEALADTPEETEVSYLIRKGTSPSPFAASEWGPYQPLGKGSQCRATIDGQVFARRYAQVRAVLRTTNPLASPVIRSLTVRAKVVDATPPLNNVFVRHSVNPKILYPSVEWQWEKADRPEFAELRSRENLDELVQGSRTQFEAQVRLMDHATKRWREGGPLPEYPLWDALSIVNRIDKTGSGGMCIQANNFLAGMCMAYGWQARLVNITAHETCEVWNDDFGKWIYLDGYFVNHYVADAKTGEPLSILEMHQRFLDRFFPDRPIDWMNDDVRLNAPVEEFGTRLGVGGPRDIMHNGISLATFARMAARNNWYEKPYPRPLTHGCTWWPWDGYVNWYDERTPPKRQYSWHTDRPQDMWPELNRVRVHINSANGDDRLFLRFETYTPNFSHYEVDVDDTGWKETGERWVWRLQSGSNTLRVRTVNQQGAYGKPSEVSLNRIINP